MKRNNILFDVSNYLSLTEAKLLEISRKAPLTYKHFTIPKRNGGFRSIHHPSGETKNIQYALMNIVLNKLPIHKCAMGFIPNKQSPLLKNATLHSKFKYTIRLDIFNFFPSITFDDFYTVLSKKYNNISKPEKEFLKNSLFIINKFKKSVLAIGAPSSPIISNIIMYYLDKKINALGRKISSSFVYTRYADDLIFSTNIKRACREFYQKVEALLKQTNSPNLKINFKKKKYI